MNFIIDYINFIFDFINIVFYFIKLFVKINHFFNDLLVH